MSPLVWLAPIAVIGFLVHIWRASRERARERIREHWGTVQPRERRMDDIVASYRSRIAELGGPGVLDDRTWNDLLLDDVFAGIDRTESTMGQHALYHRLRSSPTEGDRRAFGALVEHFGASVENRERGQLALGRLQDPQGYNVWWIARPAAMDTPVWYVAFPALATVICLMLLGSAWNPQLRPWLVAALAVNLIGNFTILRRVSAAVSAFRQLAPIIATAQSLQFLGGDAIGPVVGALRKDTPALRRLKTISRWVSGDPFMLSVSSNPLFVAVGDLLNVVFEYVNMIVPITATGLYFGAADLRARGAALLRVVTALGDVDAAISVASLRASRTDWARPTFTQPGEPAVIVDARHLLITDAVPNSITLPPAAGVLVTGSNMSGKSTFLRTVGITAVLAQTIDTCFAAEYRAPVFVVRSCIGRSDDLLSGKSYYLVEVESLLELIAVGAEPRPHLFLLDELFRGTNAVERIAAGQSVLTELVTGAGNANVVLAATHDTELVDLLDGSYAACHFGDAIGADGLTFDHRLKPGRATSRNAIALLRQHGGSSRLIDRALACAATLDAKRSLAADVPVSKAPASPRPRPLPPATRIDRVIESMHGVDVVDDYRWLEGDTREPANPQQVTPEVTAWTDAQNAYTREVLDHLPGRAALEARLRQLMEVGSVSAPAMRASRYFLARREGRQNQPVHYWREGAKGEDRVLVDPAAIDPTGLTAVEWLSPSADGRLAAFGTYKAGDENTTLHLMDVDSGRRLPLEIPNKTQAPDWLPDASGFVYQNLLRPDDPYSGQVLFHRLGQDVSTDALIFRQYTAAENEKLATTWGPFGSLSDDGLWLVLGYWVDTKSTDIWLMDFAKFRAAGAADRVVVSVGTPGLASGTVIDGTLYLHTTKGAPRGRVIAVSAGDPHESHWREIVPERDDVIEGVSFAHGCVAVTYLRNAASVIEVFGLAGDSRGLVALPGIGAAAVVSEIDRTEAYLTFTSFNYPTSIFAIDLASPAAPPVVWEQPPVPVDPTTVDVEQVWYRSKDGTRVSMFLVHRKGLHKSGHVPTLLTGYGGFNVNETPVFSAPLFQWFEAGGLFAMPNLRGGGEYGDAWHEAGILDRKQNVFDDFIAAAEWLVAEGYTTPERLAISGGSNGGLLTGAALTQRPDLFGAVVIAVPLLDMLRYERFLMARYWVPEYGSAAHADQFRFLMEYSPYQHVVPGTRYPAVFLTAGEHDSRVHALHARKMAARLQAATASDPRDRPVLLWVDREAGHGQGKPLDLRIRDAADQRLFVMWQLGMLEP